MGRAFVFSVGLIAGCAGADELFIERHPDMPVLYQPHPHEDRHSRSTYACTDQYVENLQSLTAEIERLKHSTAGAEALAKVHLRRGIEHWAAQRLDAAIADYSMVIELQSDAWEAYFHRWQAYLEQGDEVKAEADRQIGLTLNPPVFRRTYSRQGGLI